MSEEEIKCKYKCYCDECVRERERGLFPEHIFNIITGKATRQDVFYFVCGILLGLVPVVMILMRYWCR